MAGVIRVHFSQHVDHYVTTCIPPHHIIEHTHATRY